MENFQRVGSVSNSHVGREFEALVKRYFYSEGVSLTPNIKVAVGVAETRKDHAFDLGSQSPPILVECKSHKWTSGGNVPSAKITTWDQAMYYFAISPPEFRKLFCVLKDTNPRTGEILSEYYVRLRSHLIPADVEVWEFEQSNTKRPRESVVRQIV